MEASKTESTGIRAAVETWAVCLNRGADIVLEELPPAGEWSDDSPWQSDLKIWPETVGSDEVAGWVSETTGIYLGEVAHLLRAFADVMLTGEVFVTQDLITRSIIERVGHVNWILDHRIGARKRGARAGLEVAASYFTYKAGLSLMGGSSEDRAKIRAEAKAQRVELERCFDVDRPHEVEDDADSPLSGDVTRWTVDGEAFPKLTATAELALEGGGVVGDQARGTYATFSGFAHPNVIFSREHRSIDAEGRVTFEYGRSAVEKAARFALFSFGDGLMHWTQYFGCDPEGFLSRFGEISDMFEKACRGAAD